MNNQYDPNNNYNQAPQYDPNQGMVNQPMYNQQVVQTNQKTNTACIVGFILSFICCIPLIGLIVSIVGLSSAKKKNEGGRGLATAGIVISLVWIIIAVVIMILGINTYKEVESNVYLQTACANLDPAGNYDSREFGSEVEDDYVVCEDYECTYHKGSVTLSKTC